LKGFEMRILKWMALALVAVPMAAHAQPVQPSAPASGTMEWNNNQWQGVGPNNPLAIDQFPLHSPAATDHSGAITQGGSWQEVTGSNPNRLRFLVMNFCTSTSEGISTTESIFFDLAATQPQGAPTSSYPGAIELAACGSYDSSTAIVGTAPIWIWAATTGHRFLEKDW
jgi:hypothetical protein